MTISDLEDEAQKLFHTNIIELYDPILKECDRNKVTVKINHPKIKDYVIKYVRDIKHFEVRIRVMVSGYTYVSGIESTPDVMEFWDKLQTMTTNEMGNMADKHRSKLTKFLRDIDPENMDMDDLPF